VKREAALQQIGFNSPSATQYSLLIVIVFPTQHLKEGTKFPINNWANK